VTAAVHLVVPRGVDDALRPSGGNTYDRELGKALRARGRRVDVVEVEGGWPWSSVVGSAGLAEALQGLPDGAVALVDGLLASRLPHVMVPASRRLRVVLLVHLPVGVADEPARLPERRVVAAATAVLTPSEWCRGWLVREYGADPDRVHVAHPGVERARVAPGSASGASLLTVGAVSTVKGHDQLVTALADVRDLRWSWTAVGSTDVEPDATGAVRRLAADLGIGDRCTLAGPQAGSRLQATYAAADLLVLPSRAETYGMVVTEALSHGLPVLAHDVGGVREALGETVGGGPPGLLVRGGDRAGLAAALRSWLTDPALRRDLRAASLERRSQLGDWSVTADLVADVVRQVAA
jgi:glycosyltransferase involved in cell wall biosynthesis